MQHLEDTAEESLLQKPVRALWRICRARQRLWQEPKGPEGSRQRLDPRCWESSWQSLGPFAQLAFRLYASGDGDAAEGTSVIFFWMEKPPILSFSFIVTVGAEEVTMQTWSSEAVDTVDAVPPALLGVTRDMFFRGRLGIKLRNHAVFDFIANHAGAQADCASYFSSKAAPTAADDECRDESCALNALQLHSQRARELNASHPPLCDPSIVAETCEGINKLTSEYYGTTADKDLEVIHAAELSEHIMASRSSVLDFFNQYLGLENQEDRDP
eukprot:g17745.t1